MSKQLQLTTVTQALNIQSPTPALSTQLLHFALFQCAWFAAVLGAAHQLAWLGLLCIGLMLAWHLSRAVRPRRELMLVLCAVLVGVAFEALNARLGYLRAVGQLNLAVPAPWLVAMWALLALNLNVSLRWLKPRLWLAAVVGALVGPLAYAAGAQLHALKLVEPMAALISLSLGWSVLLPLLVWLSIRFDGVAP